MGDLLLRKSCGAAGNKTHMRLVDDDCMAALLVKAHARAGRPHGGEGRTAGHAAGMIYLGSVPQSGAV